MKNSEWDRIAGCQNFPTPAETSVLRLQERIVQAGAVPAIIALSVGEGVDVELQRRCAAALCNLACTPANIARMVQVWSRIILSFQAGSVF